MAKGTDERTERLKAALRDNLKRRKDQSRARAGTPPTARDATGQDMPDGEPQTSFGQKVPYSSAD